MAKVFQGAYGTFKNRFMNAVQYKWRGIIVAREHNDSPNNPKTADQTKAREKFAVLTKLGGYLMEVLNMTMAFFIVAKKTTANGQFVKQNYENGLDSGNHIDYEHITITPENSKLTPVGMGELDCTAPGKIACAIESANVNAQINSENDKVYLVAINTDNFEVLMSDGTAKRTTVADIVINAPNHWTGSQVQVWAFVKAADNTPHDKKAFSQTIYVGHAACA